MSGFAIHLVLIRAFERTVNRELDTLSGTVHDTLEAILEQPGIVNPMATGLLPGLCLTGKICAPIKANAKIAELTQKQGYCLRLLDLRGQEIAKRQIRHLTCLAEDLLWLSRLEAKQLPVKLQPCCLNDLVSDLEEELAPLAIAASIDLCLEILTSQQLYTIGDSDRLYRSISNLIHNAIKYTPAGGVVTIRLESADRDATITISDNGIGIAGADLPHIFDRCYRVQSDRSRATGGTGLGLAIANAIIRSHQGTIQVQSQVESSFIARQGTIFTVRLPAKTKLTGG